MSFFQYLKVSMGAKYKRKLLKKGVSVVSKQASQ